MFESSSKSRKSWNGRRMVWQRIPNIWSNRWQWFGSCNGGFTWRNAYWERRRRAEWSGGYISWNERWKIGWLLRLEHSESNCSNFKANSVANRKPMQIRKDRCDVAEPRHLCDNSSKSILDTLKASQIWNGCASQERVAEIKSGANYCCGYGSRSLGSKRSTNVTCSCCCCRRCCCCYRNCSNFISIRLFSSDFDVVAIYLTKRTLKSKQKTSLEEHEQVSRGQLDRCDMADDVIQGHSYWPKSIEVKGGNNRDKLRWWQTRCLNEASSVVSFSGTIFPQEWTSIKNRPANKTIWVAAELVQPWIKLCHVTTDLPGREFITEAYVLGKLSRLNEKSI